MRARCAAARVCREGPLPLIAVEAQVLEGVARLVHGHSCVDCQWLGCAQEARSRAAPVTEQLSMHCSAAVTLKFFCALILVGCQSKLFRRTCQAL